MVVELEPSWPPELGAALFEFHNWSQSELQREQDETTPTKPLYHYTGEDAVKGILSTERLWCFSHLHQTDRTEFIYSLGLAKEIIKRIGRSPDRFRRDFCGCLNDLLDNNPFPKTFGFYLFSFSQHRDDSRQWEEYGKAGSGFAVGFAPTLFQPDRLVPNDQANENVWVGRVIYGDATTKKRLRLVIQKAAAITSKVGWANQEAVNQLRPHVYFHRMATEVIASPLIWYCLTSKHLKYSNEQEVRFVSLNVREKYDAYQKTYDGRNYIEVPLRQLRKEGNITEILVGRRAPTGAEQMIREFLLTQGYPGSIRVCRSAVP